MFHTWGTYTLFHVSCYVRGLLGDFFRSLRIEGVVCCAGCEAPLRLIYWATQQKALVLTWLFLSLLSILCILQLCSFHDILIHALWWHRDTTPGPKKPGRSVKHSCNRMWRISNYLGRSSPIQTLQTYTTSGRTNQRYIHDKSINSSSDDHTGQVSTDLTTTGGSYHIFYSIVFVT